MIAAPAFAAGPHSSRGMDNSVHNQIKVGGTTGKIRNGLDLSGLFGGDRGKHY